MSMRLWTNKIVTIISFFHSIFWIFLSSMPSSAILCSLISFLHTIFSVIFFFIKINRNFPIKIWKLAFFSTNFLYQLLLENKWRKEEVQKEKLLLWLFFKLSRDLLFAEISWHVLHPWRPKIHCPFALWKISRSAH